MKGMSETLKTLISFRASLAGWIIHPQYVKYLLMPHQHSWALNNNTALLGSSHQLIVNASEGWLMGPEIPALCFTNHSWPLGKPGFLAEVTSAQAAPSNREALLNHYRFLSLCLKSLFFLFFVHQTSTDFLKKQKETIEASVGKWHVTYGFQEEDPSADFCFQHIEILQTIDIVSLAILWTKSSSCSWTSFWFLGCCKFSFSSYDFL